MKSFLKKSWSKATNSCETNHPIPLFCSDKYPTPRYCPSPESNWTSWSKAGSDSKSCFSRRDCPCLIFVATWRLTVSFFIPSIIAKVCSFHKERLYLLELFLLFYFSSYPLAFSISYTWSFLFLSSALQSFFSFSIKMWYTCIWKFLGNKTRK